MTTTIDELRALIARGLTFAECVAVFAEIRTTQELAYVSAAREKHISDEGHIEVEDAAIVNLSEDDGAYVMSWTWIDDTKVQS